MIKKNLKTLIITSVAILLPILAGIILWDKLPDQIPTHWNAQGEIDGWSSKTFAILGLPLIMLAIQWLAVIVTCSDPKRNNHSEKILNFVFWIVPVLCILLSALMYSVAMGKDIPLEAITPALLGLLFIVIGNYMPKCKQNYTIGIKIPWTLNSEENWNKTHRFAGWLWVIGGIFIIATSLFSLIWISLLAISIMALIPIIYSYILHKKGI
jgi:uncharacterized membrane protein